MAHPDSIVIVGGGLAGAKGAEGLREQGFQGGLTVIGAENQLPYERPPLSKSYLQGKSTLADAQVHNSVWYDDNSVDLRLATTVAAFRPCVASRIRTRFEKHSVLTAAWPSSAVAGSGSRSPLQRERPAPR